MLTAYKKIKKKIFSCHIQQSGGSHPHGKLVNWPNPKYATELP